MQRVLGDTTKRKSTKSGRPAYHHGNLRQALIDVAIAEVRRLGAEKITLRSLALAAGVSANAPYRHFDDIEAILDEVTAFAITLLHDRSRHAATLGESPKDSLRKMAEAWLAWAVEEEHLMRLAGDLRRIRDAAPDSVLSQTQPILWDVVLEAVTAAYPDEGQYERSGRALVFTSVLYGYILMHKRSDQVFAERDVDVTRSDHAIVAAAVGG